MELAVLKAAVGQVRQEYAFSQRRACGLLTMAVSSYRYQSRRSDEGLRERLVELAREKPRFGYRRLHVLLRRKRRSGESQARASGVSGGGIEYSAKEAQALRADRTAAASLHVRRIRSGRWTSCTTRWKAGERSGC